jgi:hypothetical protein
MNTIKPTTSLAHLTLFGATNASLLAQVENGPQPVTFGLYSLLYGTPQEPAVCRYDEAGKVAGYSLLQPLNARQFLTIEAGPAAPQIGKPYENGAVVDPASPVEIQVGPWDLVANHLLANYDLVREGVFTHPLEGYFVAKFLSHDAVNYTKNGGAGYNVAAAQSKIAQMELLRGALFMCHPEWEKNGQVSWPDFPRAEQKHGGIGMSN